MTHLQVHHVPHPSWFKEFRRWLFNCPNHTAVVRRGLQAHAKKTLVTREAEGLVVAIRRSHESQS